MEHKDCFGIDYTTSPTSMVDYWHGYLPHIQLLLPNAVLDKEAYEYSSQQARDIDEVDIFLLSEYCSQ